MEETIVSIPSRGVRLDGTLSLAPEASAMVLFAHGSGSSRNSPRNRFVAEVLRAGNLSTLLFDLLTPEEEQIDARAARLRFDIAFLARRLVDAMDWAANQPETKDPRIGLFGASTGAAAALIAAAQRPGSVGAVVSRGGRPDLAALALPEVAAPTLLIVGGNDAPVIKLNRQAFAELSCAKDLQIIPGASHLFEEPGTLEQAARLARQWFRKHLLGVA